MKPILGGLAILLSVIAASGQALNEKEANRLADAIYRVEGGPKAKVPYGILSVKVHNKRQARKICLNTIQNTFQRWLNDGQKRDFLDYLADRYCPPSDSVGNKNWKRNVRRILHDAKPSGATPVEEMVAARPAAPAIEEAAGANTDEPNPEPDISTDSD